MIVREREEVSLVNRKLLELEFYEGVAACNK